MKTQFHTPNPQRISARKILASVFCLVTLTACAPGLGTTFPVRHIGDAEVSTADSKWAGSGLRAHVLKLIDNRTIEAIAQVDGRFLKPDADIGTVVQLGIERALRSHGVQVSLFDSPTIRGRVLEWIVTVRPGFPISTAEAKARIELDVLDTNDRPRFTGRYEGTYEKQDPFLSNDEIGDVLSQSMALAIQEAVSDGRLSDAVAVAQAPGYEG